MFSSRRAACKITRPHKFPEKLTHAEHMLSTYMSVRLVLMHQCNLMAKTGDPLRACQSSHGYDCAAEVQCGLRSCQHHRLASLQMPLLSYLHSLETVLTALVSLLSLTVVADAMAAVNPAVKPTETVHAMKMVQGVASVIVHGRVTATSSLFATRIEAVSAAVTVT